ncbi:MAG: polysaccharide biosynthesis tyrosine autokinase [Planctomycetota bacterium]
MTTMPPPPRLSSAPPPVATSGISLDPAKLLRKYLVVLIVSTIVAIGLGVAVYFQQLYFNPQFESTVRYEVTSAPDSLTGQDEARNLDELEFFMNTQIQLMQSAEVLDATVSNPAAANASTWYAEYSEGGSFQPAAALRAFEDQLTASVVPGTFLIEVAVRYRSGSDAFRLVGLHRDVYMQNWRTRTNTSQNQQQIDIRAQVDELTTRIDSLQDRRENRLTSGDIDSLNEQQTNAARQLDLATAELIMKQQEIAQVAELRDTYREQLDSPTGSVTYPDSVRAEVESDPRLAVIRNQLNALEVQRDALTASGVIGPNHRELTTLRAQIDAQRRKLESERQSLLAERFDGLVDSLDLNIAGLRRQESELLRKQETEKIEKARLLREIAEIQDADQEIASLITRRAELEAAADEFATLADTERSDRIQVALNPRLPDGRAWPKAFIIIAATLVLFMGAVSGLILLREVLDQRVKGPGDITAMGRTRLLGVVPNAKEDPGSPSDISACFLDHPSSVIAESFRQIRAPALKLIQQAGHKTITVLGASPDSGTTTIATNLALACAASDQRVLLIDANMRRPALHRVFDAREAPGLADVLTGNAGLGEAVQATRAANLDVLTAGDRERRLYEGLATQGMSALLDEAASAYDIVFIDVPPAIVSGDGLAVANRTDASILVARAMFEKKGSVNRVRSELTDAKSELLGAVVNGVRSAAGGYMRSNILATHDYHSKQDSPRPAKTSNKG